MTYCPTCYAGQVILSEEAEPVVCPEAKSKNFMPL